MSKTKKTANPSEKIIREATERYVDLVLENGCAYEWFNQCFERAVKLAEDSTILDVEQLIEIEFGIRLTHGVYNFGLAEEPIDVCLAVSTILDEFSAEMAEAA